MVENLGRLPDLGRGKILLGPAGADHVEEAQPDNVQPFGSMVLARLQVRRRLGDRVHAFGTWWIILADGTASVIAAVLQRRTHDDEPRLWGHRAQGQDHPELPHDVHVVCPDGVFLGLPRIGNGREVDHGFGPRGSNGRANGGGVAQIERDVGVPAAIRGDDLGARRLQGGDKMLANESASPGDQHPGAFP